MFFADQRGGCISVGCRRCTLPSGECVLFDRYCGAVYPLREKSVHRILSTCRDLCLAYHSSCRSLPHAQSRAPTRSSCATAPSSKARSSATPWMESCSTARSLAFGASSSSSAHASTAWSEFRAIRGQAQRERLRRVCQPRSPRRRRRSHGAVLRRPRPDPLGIRPCRGR